MATVDLTRDNFTGAYNRAAREQDALARAIDCPVTNCKALAGEPCNYLTWIDSESPTGYTHLVHNARYVRARELQEDRSDHDPGDEDRS